jgi:membrane protein required for colicin V production
MNPVDLGVIAVVVLSAIFAFARGFVREALSIIAWVGAAAITLYGFNWAFEQVDPHVHNPLLSQVIAGVGLFVGSLIVLTILTGYVARLVRISALSPIDRTLGFIFGLARGVFILCLAYLLLDLVPTADRPAWIRDAKSAPYLREGADMLRTFLPEQLKLKSASAFDDIFHSIDPKAGAEADVKKAIGAYVNPTPAQDAKANQQEAAPAYRRTEQQQLKRLMDNQSR